MNRLDAKLRGPKRAASLVGLGIVVVLVGWSAAAPLSSATVASGMVSPNSGRKTIQHLEGGIVERILVREGDAVEEGQVIATLVDAKTRASRDTQARRLRELDLQRRRLQALAEGREVADFDAIADDPSLATFVANETTLFVSRRGAFAARVSALQSDIAAAEAVLSSVSGQIAAAQEELRLIGLELATKSDLLDKGLTTKPVLLALERRRAQIDGQLATLNGQRQSQTAVIAQKKSDLGATQAAFKNEIADALAKNATELAAIELQLGASNDAIRRMDVKAPEAGTIVALKVRTPAAVLPAGGQIADYVPKHGGTVLEVRVRPTDISRVRSGQQAKVMLTSYSYREVPLLAAEVVTVSADAINDPATREVFYKVELKLDADAAAKTAPQVTLVPGMPVETYISHHERTLLTWLLEPVFLTFQRGTREN